MVNDDHMGSDVGAGSGPAQAASLPEASPQSLRLRQWQATRQRILNEQEAETACKLMSQGYDNQRVAEILCCKPYTIDRLRRSRPGKARILQLKHFLTKVEVEQRFGLAEMMPKARAVLGGVLEVGNARERAQTAQWLHEQVVTKPAVKHEHKIQGRLEHDLGPVFQQMGEHLAALRKANEEDSRQRPNEIEVGSEKLVRMLPETTE